MANIMTYLLTSLIGLISLTVRAQNLNPGETAPNFTLPTLSGKPLIYRGIKDNKTNIKPPLVFHEFTNHSGFLECLWTKDSSLLELIDNSPNNTDYVFLTSSNDAKQTAQWMKDRFVFALKKYFMLAKNLSTSTTKSEILHSNQYISKHGNKQTTLHGIHRDSISGFPKPKRRINRRSIDISDQNLRTINDVHAEHEFSDPTWYKKNVIHAKQGRSKYHDPKATKRHSYIPLPSHENQAGFHFDKKSAKRSSIYRYIMDTPDDEEEESTSDMDTSGIEERVSMILKKGKDKFIEDWLNRLHFVTLPLYQLGNWIPLVMSRWYCSGHGCGLDQIAVERKQEGDILFVSKRLDARYDWLPSPYTLKSKFPKIRLVNFGDACGEIKADPSVNYTASAALISREGNCSFFTKMQNAQRAGAVAALVFTTADGSLVDMTCDGLECEDEMKIAGTMIPYGTGQQLLQLLEEPKDVYIRFQHSPTRNFFLAIDQQGKLQEVGWLLYPSMIFLTYQAKWLNYYTSLLRNITNMDSKVINVFNYTIMQGSKGVVRNVKVPPMEDLQRYEKIYLDLSLSCPGTSDFTCPHWDHTVQLYMCCDKGGTMCGKEIGRWITPFRRRIGRWLTNIEPLIPMFTTSKCKFTIKTVPWAMPWKPALKIRMANYRSGNISVPFKIIPLFRGGKFDMTYNTKREIKKFNVSKEVTQVKFMATITGHGSDNNNCAEFCITSHHFVINNVHKNTRVFDTAGTATGCADQVSDGSEPNEHGTWMYGRNGWCDGMNVSPWIEDITEQVNIGEENSVKYYGYYNGTDPNPTRNPGYIIMYSYLIFYRPSDESLNSLNRHDENNS